MKLDILTPEEKLFSGEVDSVLLPGAAGMFMVLENHAPLISPLRKEGMITYVSNGKEGCVDIAGGFVEVLDNRVTVCVEIAPDISGSDTQAGNADI